MGTFLQISSKSRDVSKAVAKLRALAHETSDLKVAKLAMRVKSGGHFDDVIASIDAMIEVLRKEGKADIEHRDRCEGAENKNGNDMEDLNHEIDKTDKAIQRMGDQEKTLKEEIEALETEIKETKEEMEKQLDL